MVSSLPISNFPIQGHELALIEDLVDLPLFKPGMDMSPVCDDSVFHADIDRDKQDEGEQEAAHDDGIVEPGQGGNRGIV